MDRFSWLLAALTVVGCDPGAAGKEGAVDGGGLDGRVDAPMPCTHLVASKPVTLITSAGSALTPTIAGSASGFGVAWMDSRQGSWALYFAPVSAAGKAGLERALATGLGASSSDIGEPRIASDGAEYGLLWGTGAGRASVALVDGNGYVREKQQLPADTRPAALTYNAQRKSYGVGFLRQDYARYKTNAARPYLALLDPTTATLGTPIELSADASDELALTPLGDGFGLFADHELSYGNTEIYWQTSDGVKPPSGKGTKLTDLPDKAIFPHAVAGSDGRSGVVWAEWKMAFGGGRTAYWMQTDASGKVLGPTPLAEGGNPGIAWTGREYVVAWAAQQALTIARVDPDSGQIVGTPTTISEVPFDATGAVAWSGSSGAVVWETAGRKSLTWVGLRCE
jgi:hypothetical protein